MGPIGCRETSLKNYCHTLRKIPKERISHVHRGGILKSREFQISSSNVCVYPRPVNGSSDVRVK